MFILAGQRGGGSMNRNEINAFIEGLYRTYHSELLQYAKGRISKEDAEDVINELWHMAVMKAELLYDHPNKVAWLYSALNICILRYRSNKKSEAKTIPIDDEILGTIGREDTYQEGIFEEYKEFLTESEYKYIIYKFDKGMSNQEIADILNKSYSSVTSLGNRIKNKIKKSFKET